MFLKNYATGLRENPSIDDEIKDVIVYVLLDDNLGYRTGYFGLIKTVVEIVICLAVASFKFVPEHFNKLIRYQRNRFGSPIFREFLARFLSLTFNI